MIFVDNIYESFFFDTLHMVNLMINLPCKNIILCLLEIAPEIILLCLLLYNLICIEKKNSMNTILFSRWICNLGLILFFFIFQWLLCLYFENSIFNVNTQYIVSYYTQYSKIFIVLLTLCVVFMSKSQLTCSIKNRHILPEILIMMGFSMFFLLLLLSTQDFFYFFLVLEGLSLTLYVLSAMLHTSFISLESAVKYFVLGTVSSGIFLFGLSLLYGIVGSVNFDDIQLYLTSSYHRFELKIAVGFLLFGFFFKLSVFPCH